MAISPAHRPDDNSARPGSNVSGTDSSRAFSGTDSHDDDPTNMTGQYPPGGWGNAIFGGPLPAGTGAPGTQGATQSAASDPTNEPGQTRDGLTGVSEHDITSTGAPGTPTAVPDAANDSSGDTLVSFTAPGSYSSGTYQSETLHDDLAGPADSTQANDQGYATGGPQLPGLKGNEPQAGSARYQPAGGHVLRGGRAVRG